MRRQKKKIIGCVAVGITVCVIAGVGDIYMEWR